MRKLQAVGNELGAVGIGPGGDSYSRGSVDDDVGGVAEFERHLRQEVATDYSAKGLTPFGAAVCDERHYRI